MRSAAFAPISYKVKRTGNSNDNNQSFELSFELQFQLQIKVEANLLDENMNEVENELSRLQMKQVKNQFREKEILKNKYR